MPYFKNFWTSLTKKRSSSSGIFRSEQTIKSYDQPFENSSGKDNGNANGNSKNLSRSFGPVWPKNSQWPTAKQWQRFFKVLTRPEKIFLTCFSIAIIISLVFPLRAFYLNHTEIMPAEGGTYTEAIVGTPRYINPVLSPANDVDRDVTAIIYSSIVKHVTNNEVIFDLAENYSLSEDRKTYQIFIKKGVKWHDGQELTANDIVFTTQIIQSPDYRSPLRSSLQGVEIVKIDDYSMEFRLKNPYGPFLDNLTFGILPKHIWENVPPASFPLTEINLKPIGSGPYKFKRITKDSTGKIKSLELEAFKDYHLSKPYLETIFLKFYKDEDSAIKAFNSREADGMSFLSANKVSQLRNNSTLNKFILPRYFAVFFNASQNKALTDINIRKALLTSTDKRRIIDDIMLEQAVVINSPVPHFILDNDFSDDQQEQVYSPADALSLIEAGGWELATTSEETASTTEQIRQKKIEDQTVPLAITLTTVNWPELIDVANLLKENWESIGVKVDLDILPVAEIQERIKDRQYQALLFGQILGAKPDPFAFWHSSQKQDPGLNLALYENKEADKILEELRQNSDLDDMARNQKYEELRQLTSKDLPAIFLYSPIYIYPSNPKIKVFQLEFLDLPSARFAQIENWYIETKRGWRR